MLPDSDALNCVVQLLLLFAQCELYLKFDTAAYSVAQLRKLISGSGERRCGGCEWVTAGTSRNYLLLSPSTGSLTARTLTLVDDAGCSDNDRDRWQRTVVYDMLHACQHLLPSHTLDRYAMIVGLQLHQYYSSLFTILNMNSNGSYSITEVMFEVVRDEVSWWHSREEEGPTTIRR